MLGETMVETPHSYVYDRVIEDGETRNGESVSVDADSEFMLEAYAASWSDMMNVGVATSGFSLKLQDGNGNYLSNQRIETMLLGGGTAPQLFDRPIVYPPGSRITFDIASLNGAQQVQLEFRGYKRMVAPAALPKSA